jgi:crotonobetainyl-CoA:carnitine CoA-transferase CaiB-like acyl-CoA transferase
MATLDAQFDEAKIAFGEIHSIRELSESDWSDYWGGVREVPDRYGGSYRLPGNPWRFSAEDLKPPGAPAFQGEHNRSVFAELGLTEEEIDRHVATGALVSHMPEAIHDQMTDGKDLDARTTVESTSKRRPSPFKRPAA